MKHASEDIFTTKAIVAPFTGARIETGRSRSLHWTSTVAPFTGARIETALSPWTAISCSGRPLHGGAD